MLALILIHGTTKKQIKHLICSLSLVRVSSWALEQRARDGRTAAVPCLRWACVGVPGHGAKDILHHKYGVMV
jgi:hypothetical protein